MLGNCNEHPEKASEPECVNARAAVDRRSAADEAKRAKRAESGFEMAREARRRADEAAKQSQEALQKRVEPLRAARRRRRREAGGYDAAVAATGSCASMNVSRRERFTAPTCVAAGWPSRKIIIVGMLRTL